MNLVGETDAQHNIHAWQQLSIYEAPLLADKITTIV